MVLAGIYKKAGFQINSGMMVGYLLRPRGRLLGSWKSDIAIDTYLPHRPVRR